MSVNKFTYISLFSGAGIGCYGFKAAGFECIASVELQEKRLRFQRYNQKCKYDSGYISGDICNPKVKVSLFNELEKWKILHRIVNLDVVIATPPCQGMSVANHKKKNELSRNSLILESIEITKTLKPKFFVFENVRTFFNTLCKGPKGNSGKIRDVIEASLSGEYNVIFKIVNFKDYGVPSSRSRSVVLGVRKDLKEYTPFDIFPEPRKEITLKEAIGQLPSLKIMGEITPDDIYHSYRRFDKKMLPWIVDLKEGESAFENKNSLNLPHQLINGKRVHNVNKNGDKYRRCYWNKPGPCIHTRNDILSSQNTVHPSDNRVFSIRELMIMMSIPFDFSWASTPFETLNELDFKTKQEFLKKEELNVRHCIGEAIPTKFMSDLASRIKDLIEKPHFTEKAALQLCKRDKLSEKENLSQFLSSSNGTRFSDLLKLAEYSNTARISNSAYYTRQDIAFSIVNDLPNFEDSYKLKILEPSVGVGNFLPSLIKKYGGLKSVSIDLVDIDDTSLEILKLLVKKLKVPSNFDITYIHADFLKHTFPKKYDIVLGNPPFKKIVKEKELLNCYKRNSFNQDTNNIFSFFIEKSLALADTVALIVPKSLLSAPEFDKTRELMANCSFTKLCDYGESAFKGVRIETVSFILNTKKVRIRKNDLVRIESYITNELEYKCQSYIMANEYPCWLIYRDKEFDKVANRLKLGVFESFRDRQITKKHTKNHGRFRVLKSRNIASNKVISLNGYDSYINELDGFAVARFLDKNETVMVPNLSYNPRACYLPKNCIADGSVALLTKKNGTRNPSKEDLEFYASNEFCKFYSVARNRGTRSLNIDRNSVFFFGLLKND